MDRPPLDSVSLTCPELSLVPLDASHAEGLLRCVDDGMWACMTSRQPRTGAEAVEYVQAARADPRRIPFAVVDAATGEVRGSTSFLRLDRGHGRVEVGGTFYGRRFWGGTTNPWCKLLMLEHAFEHWRLHRVSFRCDVRNARSAAAIERLGAVREGLLRGHRVAADGVRSDTVCFSLLASEWSQARSNLEQRVGSAAQGR